MDPRLIRAYLVELVGTMGFVFVAASLTCVNVMTTPGEAVVGATSLSTQQPGLVGLALGTALAWMALIAWSVPASGGYLNPAITIMRWVYGQLPGDRFAWFLGAQAFGGLIAGVILKLAFRSEILAAAGYGVPSLNPQVYAVGESSAVWAGFGIELLLTFFLVLAIFAPTKSAPRSLISAGVIAAAVLVAGPLTGAGLNPARWFGPAFWFLLESPPGSPIGRQALVYLCGPIAGALLGGLFAVRVYLPSVADGTGESS